MNPLWQLTLARIREFIREPGAVFWTFGFPVLLAVALGLAFRNRPPEVTQVAVREGPGAEELARAIGTAPLLAAEVLPERAAREKLRTGKIALVVVPGDAPTYVFDPTHPESRVARLAVDDAIQRAHGRADPAPGQDQPVTEKGARYIDFLIPGLLGMNLMSSSMWGIGWVIVNQRTKKLLRRLVVTPMRRGHYLLSYILSRLVALVFEVVALVAFGWLAFGVDVKGSFGSLALVAVVGSMAFAGLGILVSSRAQNTQTVSGLMNLAMMPMFILSGVFFSTAHFPPAMQPVISLLPLTALNDSLRAIMIDGASLAAVASPMLVLLVWGAVGFGVSLRIFRWT